MSDETGTFSQAEIEELKQVFFAQAHEIAEEFQDLLLKLEADPGNAETLKTIKRHLHTLKGDANSIGITSVGTLCHHVEDALSLAGNGAGAAGRELVDLLLVSADAIRKLLVESETRSGEGDIRDAMARIDLFLKHQGDGGDPEARAGESEYHALAIADARQRGLLVLSGEAVFHPQCRERGVAALMVAQRLAGLGELVHAVPDPHSEAADRADALHFVLATGRDRADVERECLIPGIVERVQVVVHARSRDEAATAPAPEATAGAQRQSPQTADSLRVEASRVDRIMNLVGELIIGRSMVDQAARELENGTPPAEVSARLASISSTLERSLTDLQYGVMQMRMVPVNAVFRKFPRMVRDLSLEKGKRIRLDIQGRDAELDKGIVDALGEPLMHIVRNMIDHGIETPVERAAAGKPEEGVITLRAYHEAAHVVIEASDDGRGIDTAKLRKKAVEHGFITHEDAERLSEAEARELIFFSGLSTSDSVSETSGRGVGMDAVRTAVQNLKGMIETDSVPGRGATFRLTLPLTLAVIRALLFEVGGRLFAVPVAAVAEVVRVTGDELTSVDGRPALVLRDRVISLIRLRDTFGINGNGSDKSYALLLGGSGRKAGFLVDRLAGQQELVVKAVDDRHVRTELVSGASILGDGKVVLILDAIAVYRKAVEQEKEGVARR